MKSLIAVVNARTRPEWANAVRRSWLPQVPADKADVRFFVGRGGKPVPADTVELDCDDSYQGLPEKVRAIFRWAYEREYGNVLKCDDDVILRPNALLDSGYDRFDYVGRENRKPTDLVPFTVPMGFNYWLSNKAMSHVVGAELPKDSNDDELWVARNLHEHSIHLRGDDRYRLHVGQLVNRPIRVNRPLRVGAQANPPVFGTFSWCIFLEGNSGNKIPLTTKIAEFDKVFEEHGEKPASK